MRFHLQQNVESLIQITLKILLIIVIIVACPLSGHQQQQQQEQQPKQTPPSPQHQRQYEIDAMDTKTSLASLSSSASFSSSSSLSSLSSDFGITSSLVMPTLIAASGTVKTSTSLKFSTNDGNDDNTKSSMDYGNTGMMLPTASTTVHGQPPTKEFESMNFMLSTPHPPIVDILGFSQRLSSSPTNNLTILNDSNEIDSEREDYVMTKHIASHDEENDSILSHATATIQTDIEATPPSAEGAAAASVEEAEAAMKLKMGIEEARPSEIPTFRNQQLSRLYPYTYEQQQQQLHQKQKQHEQFSLNENFNKTQDLSSLSLLSIDGDVDDNGDDYEDGGVGGVRVSVGVGGVAAGVGGGPGDDNEGSALEGTALQKRLVDQKQVKEQQQQQQHQHQHQQRHGSNKNNINSRSKNNRNTKGATTGSANGTMMSNFQHIGSQRIALKSPMEEEMASASASSATFVTPSQTGSIKNMKNIVTPAPATATATGNRKVESKYILPKPQKTDAPMLNYIFDTFSSANKHHHHDQRYGPHFEDIQRVGKPTNMTVQAGSSIHLNCRISLLQDKTVSWVRRNAMGENALDLLTVGLHTYTGDKRYKLEFQYPNNWRLKITNVKKDDEASYECQISTHPPRVIQINLLVNAPKVMVVDEFGDPLQEKYYEIDSTLQLSCIVRNVAMTTSVVYWKHGEDILNYDVTRGGVSVKTELMDDGANSTLSIAKINKADSGNYTCSISDFQNFTIVVHILNGESFAELHHGAAGSLMLQRYPHTFAIHLTLLIFLLCLPSTYYIRR